MREVRTGTDTNGVHPMSITFTPADVLPDVRETLKSFAHLVDDDPTIVHACEMLAALYNAEALPPTHADPARLDPRAFDGRRGGGVPDLPAAPDAWRGEHTVKRGRNRKGATAKVLARGDAPVIGRMDVDCHGRPLLAAPSLVSDVLDWSWCAARMLVDAAAAPEMVDGRPNADHLRRHRSGWSGIGVARLTDAAGSLDADFPRLLGTDAEAWATVVPGDRSSRSPVAFQRADLSGLSHHPTIGRFVAPAAGYGTHTSKLAWQARQSTGIDRDKHGNLVERPAITYRARKSDPSISTRDETVTVPWHRHIIRSPYVPATLANRRGHLVAMFPETFHRVTVLPSAADTPAVRTVAADGHIAVRTGTPERLHIGRVTIPRAARIDRDKHGTPVKRGAIAARTIGTVTAPETVDGWATLLETLNRGERVICQTETGNVTVTRGKGGQYAATDKREGREQTIRGMRGVNTLAARLAH